jgi:hypothetical protein
MCVRVSTSRQPRQRVRSLYQRANGYSYPAVKIFMPAGAKKAVYAPHVEHMLPDVLLQTKSLVKKYGLATRVERSLYERANGYNYEAVRIFMPAGSEQPVVVHYVEHCPPDVGAAFIWLKNRDPERWR